MAGEHVMQHPDSPTWCVHCGTFDIYCVGRSCADEQTGEYDSAVNGRKMFTDLFGIAEEKGRDTQ